MFTDQNFIVRKKKKVRKQNKGRDTYRNGAVRKFGANKKVVIGVGGK